MGIENEAAFRATALMTALAQTVQAKWGGYVQRFLRNYGGKMVQELGSVLTHLGLETTKANNVAILWLQNAANMPLLLSSEADVQSFCARFRVSPKRLVDIIDGLGLNVAVFDDLIAYERHLCRNTERATAAAY